MTLTVPFIGNNFTGLFTKMKRMGFPVVLSGPQSLVTEFFCYEGFTGGLLPSLIDGDPQTSWCNSNIVSSDTYFVVDLQLDFMFGEYSIGLVCKPPKIWKIFGSNDGLFWKIVDERTETLNDRSNYHFKAKFPGRFRYFKFIQIEPLLAGYHRLHLNEIEFFSPSAQSQIKRKLVNHPFILATKFVVLLVLSD